MVQVYQLHYCMNYGFITMLIHVIVLQIKEGGNQNGLGSDEGIAMPLPFVATKDAHLLYSLLRLQDPCKIRRWPENYLETY